MPDLPNMIEFRDFRWKVVMASVKLKSFVDSNFSVSELDRLKNSNKLLFDALYENCQGSDMTFLDKLEELMKCCAYLQQELEDKQYPFSDGDTYYTLEGDEWIESCWDTTSEEMHDANPNKKYYKQKNLESEITNA